MGAAELSHAETNSGSTIRIDQVKSAAGQYAVYFHCQTNLVETFRELYPTNCALAATEASCSTRRTSFREPALRHCVALALTYHLNKRKGAR